ncbi:MAG: helix-turn-helix transcriptional regulator [Verrucomicrobiota bacterium]
MILQLLNELVPTDNSGLNRFKLDGELSVITLPENLASEEHVKIIGRLAHQNPLAAYYFATNDGTWKMPTDFCPQEDFEKLALVREGYAPLGIRYQIAAILAMMEGTAHALTLHRTTRPFEEREREILNAIHPHLVNSYVNALVHSRVKDSLSEVQAAIEMAPGAYGHFGARGNVIWLQERAKTWLNEFFPEEVRNAEEIPQSVSQLLKESLRQNQAPRQLEKLAHAEILTVCLGPSPVGGWFLRLERKPTSLPPHFRPLPQFSQRKNEVLKWMVEGKRNAEIATILRLSPRTVETHVANILAQLVVENRATAILRVMELCAVASTTA